MTAAQRRDFTTLERILAPQFVYTDNGIGRQTRAQWLDGVRTYDLEQFAFKAIEVMPYGDVAIAIVTYDQTGRRNGEPRSGLFLITDVWHRTGGGWQVIARSSILKQPS
jgi:ketosteroid isomerase-like protein